MKGAGFLILGLAAVGVGLFFAERSSAAPTPDPNPNPGPNPAPSPGPGSSAPGPKKLDPTLGQQTIINLDVVVNDGGVQRQAVGLPAGVYVTSPSMTSAGLGNVPGIMGTVSSWVASQTAAGHRVFQGPTFTTPQAPNEIGTPFVLDVAPAGYFEVVA